MSRIIAVAAILLFSLPDGVCGGKEKQQQNIEKTVENLDKPLYSPFVERYVLDELKQLRTDMAAQKTELIQQIVDRELSSADRGVIYATNTITYFFYLIAGATSILVLVGWSSIREMKDRGLSLADEKISKLVKQYEQRLKDIEQQLHLKTQHIEDNRTEIERTRELQSLWLRAAQDNNPANKIVIYDQILKLHGNDCEALTYKADAVLELGEPQWAANLCRQALVIDPDNSHAFYQLACACTALQQYEEAVRYLGETLTRSETYREDIAKEPALQPLHDFAPFRKLLLLNEE
ncbi:MAG: hypothetical protein CVV13_07360 [Gammaproteobacteria bacterium HGW-Gammaproteobacteria-3]|jgi:tetratricopeptide (TPR) repeat protein|nr:MAG: hypothetical protein CVV13_07360 [Gammaproteobacteria bacterium HGW-Gammaproteobacteria-3]